MDIIDLRSDTVTRPTPAMRAAMAAADVGDDQFGEDPTVNRLQERMAGLLGKEVGLWLPTGTMANQVALRVFTRPGDDVIVSRESHAMWHETGAAAANAGIQFTEVGSSGTFGVDEFVAAAKPRGHLIYPPTTLVQVEDTHNRAGGVVFPPPTHAPSVPPHASAASPRTSTARACSTPPSPAVILRPAAPNPSASSRSPCRRGSARRGDRFSPGPATSSARQCVIAGWPAVRCDRSGSSQPPACTPSIITSSGSPRTMQRAAHRGPLGDERSGRPRPGVGARTNILVFGLADHGPDAPTVAARARERGDPVFAFVPRVIRAVSHLDVSGADCRQAASWLLEAIDSDA